MLSKYVMFLSSDSEAEVANLWPMDQSWLATESSLAHEAIFPRLHHPISWCNWGGRKGFNPALAACLFLSSDEQGLKYIAKALFEAACASKVSGWAVTAVR